MTTPAAPVPTLDTRAVRTHFIAAIRTRTPRAVGTALAEVPVMLAEIERLSRLLTRARIDAANLLAAARATLAADGDEEPDPLSYLRDETQRHAMFDPADAGRRR